MEHFEDQNYIQFKKKKLRRMISPFLGFKKGFKS